MAGRITGEQRAAVLAAHAAGKTRNDIVRETGVCSGSVSNICKAAGVGFDRSKVKAATRARAVDMAARRAAISETLLDRADKFLADMLKPTIVFNFGGKDNTYEQHVLSSPPAETIKALMLATSTALQRHEQLVKLDAADSAEAPKGMLVELAEQLGIDDA